MAVSPAELCAQFGYPDTLRSVLEQLRELALTSYPDLCSLLLSGSITTGDFVVGRGFDGQSLLSDIDAFLFVEGRPRSSEAFLAGVEALEREYASPLFHIDVSVNGTSSLQSIPRTYQMVETALAGVVLAGKDVRSRFPRDFEPGTAIGAFLFNLWKGVLYWPGRREDWDAFWVQVLARLFLDVPLVALARLQRCIPGHRRRGEAFLQLPESNPLVCPETRSAIERALAARSGETVARRELEGLLLPVVDRVLDALDTRGPVSRRADAELASRLHRLLPRRRPRRVAGEMRALLRHRAGPLRDLAWLIRRKEASGTAAVLGLLSYALEGAVGPPPRGIADRLEEFANEELPPDTGVAFFSRARRQYWEAASRLNPSLQAKRRFYERVLDAVEAAPASEVIAGTARDLGR